MKLEGVQVIDQDGVETIPTEVFYYLVVTRKKDAPGQWYNSYWCTDKDQALQWVMNFANGGCFEQKIIRVKLPL